MIQTFKTMVYNWFRWGVATPGTPEESIEHRTVVLEALTVTRDREIFCREFGHYFKLRGETKALVSNLLYQYMHQIQECEVETGIAGYDMIRHIPEKALSWQRWDLLRYLFEYHAAHEVACACREKAQDRLLHQYPFLGNSSVNQVSNLIERGEYERAKDFCQRSLSMRFYRRIASNSFRLIYTQIQAQLREVYTQDDYADFLRGKNVYIVGPAPGEIDPEIWNDPDRCVVYFTYRGIEYLPEQIRSLNIDITYYNMGNSYQYFFGEDQLGEDVTSDVKVISLKGWGAKSACKNTDAKGKIRPLFQQMGGIGFGPGNMLAIAVNDLLHYDWNSLHLTKFTMYCGDLSYEDGYLSASAGELTALHALADHESTGQFVYLKSLYERGRFKADEQLTRILGYSSREFARRVGAHFLGVRKLHEA